MSTPDRPYSLTWDQVTAFRLSRHHLLQRAPAGALTSVARDMTGAQAQLLSAAQISLSSRVRHLRLADVEEALNRRDLVRAACMRRTLFLVPSQDLAVFVRGSARRAEKDIRWAQGKGVPDHVLDATIDAVLDVLNQPLTRPEIAERVCRALGLQKQATQGEGWGNRKKAPAVPVGELTLPVTYLLTLVSARGVICYGPDRQNKPTFVRANAWIPQWQDMPREQAEDALLRLYLRAYAPATPRDFSMWSGMTLTEARHIWARRQADLATVSVEGWEATILQEDLHKLAQSELPRPSIRLLPHFDSFLLGHKEREHLVATRRHAQVYRPQGWVSPVVLVDGHAAAVWEQSRQGNHLRVDVTPFKPQPSPVITAIREQAQHLARFLGASNVDVHIEGTTP